MRCVGDVLYPNGETEAMGEVCDSPKATRFPFHPGAGEASPELKEE